MRLDGGLTWVQRVSLLDAAVKASSVCFSDLVWDYINGSWQIRSQNPQCKKDLEIQRMLLRIIILQFLALKNLSYFPPGTCSSGTVEAPANSQTRTKTWTFLPNELHFICDEGYVLRGSPVRLCINGEWSGANPECVGKNYRRRKAFLVSIQHSL